MDIRAQITHMVSTSLFLGVETRRFVMTTLDRDVSEEKLQRIYAVLLEIVQKESSMMTKAVKKNPNMVAQIKGNVGAAKRNAILQQEELERREEEDALGDMEFEMGGKKRGFFGRLFGRK